MLAQTPSPPRERLLTRHDLNPVHVAGHAVIAALLRRPQVELSTHRLVRAQLGLFFEAGPYGGTSHCGPFGVLERLPHHVDGAMESLVREDIAIHLAGPLAEERFRQGLGPKPWDVLDREAVRDLALDFHGTTLRAHFDSLVHRRHASSRIVPAMRLVSYIERLVRKELLRPPTWNAVVTVARAIRASEHRIGPVAPSHVRELILAAIAPGADLSEWSRVVPRLDVS